MPQGPRPLRLLVVDDRDQLRELIADLLATDERFGTMVLRASNGAEGTRSPRRERPDAVLLDNFMPVLTGLDALPELRRLLPTGCIALFTADSGLAGRARALGATGVVSKELSVPDVTDALDAACQQRSRSRSADRQTTRAAPHPRARGGPQALGPVPPRAGATATSRARPARASLGCRVTPAEASRGITSHSLSGWAATTTADRLICRGRSRGPAFSGSPHV
jgi:CheY-like chemotaxis protein